MRQETRELLDYIIHKFDYRQPLDKCTSKTSPAEAQVFNERQDKIQAFLRSIPDIEKHLTEGGYIQDKNGTPICHGDKVIFCNNLEEKSPTEGLLLWNPDRAMFEITYELNEQALAVTNLTEVPRTFVEKVKNEKVL
jgi:hypothetical protein